MLRTVGVVACLPAVLMIVPLRAQGPTAVPEDPVQARLGQAEARYDAEIEKQRAAVLDALDKKAASARSARDDAAVARITAEREAFDQKGELPRSVSTTTYLRRTKEARAELAAAYRKAVRSYQEAGDSAKAAAIKQELVRLEGEEKVAAAADPRDPFPVGSTWTGTMVQTFQGDKRRHSNDAVFTVTGRTGATFAGRLDYDNGEVVIEVKGKIIGNILKWSTTDAKVRRGGIGRHEYEAKISGDRLEFSFTGSANDGRRTSGKGTLHRQES